LRDLLDIGSVDRCSGAYSAGELAGVGAMVATGYVGGTRAFARQASPVGGSNFSHSLTPARWNRGSAWSRRGNRANGDFLPTTGTRPDLHDMMDATAAGIGMSAAQRASHVPWSPARRAINRVPYTPGAAMYGVGSMATNDDCTCQR
jgi:hypothetical protein